LVSGKTGDGVEQVLDSIIERIQDPFTFKKQHQKKFWKDTHAIHKDTDARALIFDSVYDPYRGVVCYVKVIDGHMKP
jgi:GTP-binding protein LepA